MELVIEFEVDWWVWRYDNEECARGVWEAKEYEQGINTILYCRQNILFLLAHTINLHHQNIPIRTYQPKTERRQIIKASILKTNRCTIWWSDINHRWQTQKQTANIKRQDKGRELCESESGDVQIQLFEDQEYISNIAINWLVEMQGDGRGIVYKVWVHI